MATTIALKNKKAKKDVVVYSDVAFRQNGAILEYCRTSMSALSGFAAGVLGLTGLYGFIFYFLSAFMLSGMLIVKAGSDWSLYFVSRKMIFLGGLFGGLFTYILFWTYDKVTYYLQHLLVMVLFRFLYGMVHVY